MSLIFSAMRKLTDVELQSKQTTMPTEQRLTSHTLLLPMWHIPGVISGTWLFAAEKKNKQKTTCSDVCKRISIENVLK